MIKVCVRQQNQIDPGQFVNVERRRGQSLRTNSESHEANSDARKQHGIGKNCDAEKIDEHRCMTKPRKRDLRIAPLPRVWLGKRRSDWSPAFARPFAEKMNEPAWHRRASHFPSFRHVLSLYSSRHKAMRKTHRTPKSISCKIFAKRLLYSAERWSPARVLGSHSVRIYRTTL